jgi:ABC-2 type transport system ATP-binding protein
MNNAIEIKNLRKEYKDFTLKDISFSLPTGYIMGFVGQNGAGKTTTIRLMLNMTDREGGEIKLLGLDNLRDEQSIKQDVAVVLDEIYFVDKWTVREVEKALKPFYANWNSALYSQYTQQFRLPLDKKVKDLSRGMKMKLMLAVAMSHEARLLILDEPTSGLDPVARDELLEILSAYISDEKKSILFSTNITSDLEKIADYITLIDHGSIFYSGTRDDLIESFRIVKGGPDDLPDPLRAKIIGLSQKRTGFSGLLRTSETKTLTKEIVTEAPTIDEILVAISIDKGSHEYHP